MTIEEKYLAFLLAMQFALSDGVDIVDYYTEQTEEAPF